MVQKFAKTPVDKLPTAAEAISEQLLAQAMAVFKTFRNRSFNRVEELREAEEWERLSNLFRVAAGKYARVSVRFRNRVAWSTKKLKIDKKTIHEQNVRYFCLFQRRRSGFGRDCVKQLFKANLDLAMASGQCEANIAIEESETLHPHVRGFRERVDASSPPYSKNFEESAQHSDLVAARIMKKIENPKLHRFITLKEVAIAFSKSESTIYRWITEKRKMGPEQLVLAWSINGRISTEIVRRILCPR